MRVVVVGSGTLEPNGERGPSAHWIEAGRARILFDCGSGTERSLDRFGLDWAHLTHLVLSHFHVDHIGGLPGLLFALRHGVEGGRHEALTLLGPPGLQAHVEALSAAYGAWVLEPGFPLELVELGAGDSWAHPGNAFSLFTVGTPHTDRSLGFRLEGSEGVVGYTGDTGWDPLLGPFFAGCQVLIAECSHLDGEGMENHLTPSELADLASAAGPDLVIPVHAYHGLNPAEIPGRLRTLGYEGRVLPGRDGLSVHLQAGAVTRTG
jgi:ribonuclease Z